MSTFSFDEADNYGTSNTGSFFTLKDDGDSARVRFLYDGINDIRGYAVHQVEIEPGKKRYVNCLRNYNDPIEKCPFCAAQMKVIPRMFLKLYNEDTEETQIWERGKTYFQKMGSLAAHYSPLRDEIIEIERSGKKGDKNTQYNFYPTESKPIDPNDEKYNCPEPVGTIILDKSADEMQEFLDTGMFPDTSEEVSRNRSEARDDRPVGRRTPSNSGRRAF